MRSSALALAALVALATAAGLPGLERRASPGCTADNCLRALTGTGSNEMATRPVLAMSDCSTFQVTTVTVTEYVQPLTLMNRTELTITPKYRDDLDNHDHDWGTYEAHRVRLADRANLRLGLQRRRALLVRVLVRLWHHCHHRHTDCGKCSSHDLFR